MTEPGSIHDLPYRYVDDDWKAQPLGWSRKRQDSGRSRSSSGDSRTDRSDQPVYQNDDDRQAAEAIGHTEQCLSCIGLPPQD